MLQQSKVNQEVVS